MSKKPGHRGAAPEDGELYEPRHWPALCEALQDLCWLLDRGYASPSAVALTGNRYDLTARQRLALQRCAFSTAAKIARRSKEVLPDQLVGQPLWLDGFNVLLAVEVALSGGVILRGRDGCCRDMAGVHAHYHRVEETIPALRLIGETARQFGVPECRWFFDRPVSNSGRVRGLMLELAAQKQWHWQVELVMNPDRILAESREIIVTSDSVVLDRCLRWTNLADWIIARHAPAARVVDFG